MIIAGQYVSPVYIDHTRRNGVDPADAPLVAREAMDLMTATRGFHDSLKLILTDDIAAEILREETRDARLEEEAERAAHSYALEDFDPYMETAS
jgi:hypothetical protein